MPGEGTYITWWGGGSSLHQVGCSLGDCPLCLSLGGGCSWSWLPQNVSQWRGVAFSKNHSVKLALFSMSWASGVELNGQLSCPFIVASVYEGPECIPVYCGVRSELHIHLHSHTAKIYCHGSRDLITAYGVALSVTDPHRSYPHCEKHQGRSWSTWGRDGLKGRCPVYSKLSCAVF